MTKSKGFALLILVGKQPVWAEPRVGQLVDGEDQDGREVFVVQRLIVNVVVPLAADLEELETNSTFQPK